MLVKIFAGWIAFNAVTFALLMTRRARPAARNRLFRWILDGRPQRPPSHHVGHPERR
jgi:hypothetical protein